MSEPTSTGRRHPDALCEECPLNDPHLAHVASRGPRTASLAIVGESPGHQEARTGQPFTGPGGRLLDSVLSEVGIDLSVAFCTTAVLCRTPDGKTPPKKAIACCKPRLLAELSAQPLHTVLSLGNVASQVLLDTDVGITTLRVGPPKRSPVLAGVEVVATLHPAACLRQSDFFPNLKNDVTKLLPEMRVSWVEPEYAVWDDEATATAGIRELHHRYQELVVDIEVGIEKDTDFDHPERYQFLCIGIGYEEGKAIIVGENALQSRKVLEQLEHVLGCSNLAAHNGKFDLAALKLIAPKVRLHFDTMLSSYCLDERPGVHSLGYRGVEVLGAPDWKHALDEFVGSGKKKRSYAFVPRELLYKYCALDVAVTWQLKEHDKLALEREGLTQLHADYNDITMFLMHAEMKGIRINEPYFAELHERYRAILDEHEAFLKEWVANPRSPMQVKAALLELGIKTESTDALSLEVIMRKVRDESDAGRFVRRLQKHRKDQKMYSNYVVGLPEKIYEGRLHTNFLMHGTTTGRLATKQPNLLNIPRGKLIKTAFLPDEGCVWVQADYKTAELRVVAIESGDANLIAVLSDPARDIHNEVSTQRYGPNFTKDQRVRGKAVVFGVGYGREAQSIAIEFDMPTKEAQAVIDALFTLYPGIPVWQKDTQHRVTRLGEDLTNRFGRKRRFHLITKDNVDNIKRECLAFIPQSTVNDINLRAAAYLHKHHGLDIRLTVHDSILVNSKPEEAEATAKLMAEVMQQLAKDLYSDVVPFFVDTSIGETWGDLS